MTRRWRLAFVLLVLLGACAKVPPNRYGVKSIKLEGMHELDPDALKICLATTERRRAGFELGAPAPTECGVGPFNRKRWHVRLRSRAWMEWPLYDRLAFQRDQERILRWYEARGFHAARILGVTFVPERAAQRDVIDAKDPVPGCERIDDDEGCAVDILITVDEGQPTLIGAISLAGVDALPRSLRKELQKDLLLKRGERWDEASYNNEKQRMRDALREQGYALAEVEGKVEIDRAKRDARVALQVKPGPLCEFGKVSVEGAPPFLVDTVRAITLIDKGDRFSLATLQSAQRAVFGAGGFMSVSVEPVLPKQGNVVDVRVVVTPTRKHRFGVGLGVQAGIVTRGDTWDPISVPQWDVHLLAKYSQERFLSGARRLQLEERPAMVVQETFPGFTEPRFGNELRAQLRQMSVFEARTAMQVTAAYIWGPDSFDTFFRHRVDTGLGFERRFLKNEGLYLSLGIKNSVYRVPDGETTMEGEPAPASSLLTYLYQRIRLEYRDNETRPHQGFMFQTEIQEAGVAALSSWRYLRSTPDFRFYIPLPFQVTMALRFALGMYFIKEADKKLDELSQQLGPRDYRLRGGGATSNRGFLPGQLGDGPDGGVRRWEATAELRVPLTGNFGVVAFFDAGDVNKQKSFRWNYPQASSGFGLRYHTIVGPLRLDFAWRIKNLQIFGPDERDPGGDLNEIDFGFAKMAGAIHLTIGESF